MLPVQVHHCFILLLLTLQISMKADLGILSGWGLVGAANDSINPSSPSPAESGKLKVSVMSVIETEPTRGFGRNWWSRMVLNKKG